MSNRNEIRYIVERLASLGIDPITLQRYDDGVWLVIGSDNQGYFATKHTWREGETLRSTWKVECQGAKEILKKNAGALP